MLKRLTPDPEQATVDDLPFSELVKRAAEVLHKYGAEHRLDYFREVEIDDPITMQFLGRKKRMLVRVKITAQSVTFERSGES